VENFRGISKKTIRKVELPLQHGAGINVICAPDGLNMAIVAITRKFAI
jgi:hypothetical protein